ncbi:MAG: mandelate racemase/muconate lactonizing enzyme family protein [Candidatus Lokiarchaeota archaeon]|nr:mandelate racemase/muconate lactonizing enzyme family protein [Candidatus Lokiarchaeota archaeon]
MNSKIFKLKRRYVRIVTPSGYKISNIEVTPVFVPFIEQVKQAMAESGDGTGTAIGVEEAWLGVDAAICKVTDNEGNQGIGEIIAWLPETGISVTQVNSSIKDHIGKYLIGESPFNIQGITAKLDKNFARHEVAKGLLDMCLYDLMGKITQRPAYDFMGGCPVDSIPLAALLPLADPSIVKAFAQMFYKQGYRTFRLKLGKSISEDLNLIKMMRETFGDKIHLRVDYNQAYSTYDAIRAIKAIEPFEIDFAEQPVDKDNYLAMQYVQKHIQTPLMSHEGCFSVNEYTMLAEMNAVRVFGINTERPGGITKGLKVMDYAAMRGLGIVLHSQPLGISSAIHTHLTAARYHQIDYATELFGYIMIEDDLIEEPLNYHDGRVDIPHGPGWGIMLDEKSLRKYATGPTITIN